MIKRDEEVIQDGCVILIHGRGQRSVVGTELAMSSLQGCDMLWVVSFGVKGSQAVFGQVRPEHVADSKGSGLIHINGLDRYTLSTQVGDSRDSTFSVLVRHFMCPENTRIYV
jgi:hypothetical protein